jgi:hypothetical protein
MVHGQTSVSGRPRAIFYLVDWRMKMIAINEVPSLAFREKSSNRRFAGATHGHEEEDQAALQKKFDNLLIYIL